MDFWDMFSIFSHFGNSQDELGNVQVGGDKEQTVYVSMALGLGKYLYIMDLLFPDSLVRVSDLQEQDQSVDIQGKRV